MLGRAQLISWGWGNPIPALRYDGIVQQLYVATNPDSLPSIPSIPLLAAYQATQTIQRISPTLRAPSMMQSAVSVERQLPHTTPLAITYSIAHGLHLLRS